ncbi:lytic murein transglycosylase [Aestuariivirga sp.]|uniref:lytic murein transglycosylase n=1 Tax=Aestuariivirga sp. TaxID=2650926 RepID=UPI0025B924FC|nr:lytic murein transglycosylase [Aestuariivirga sp.]MCA3556549.1 lytic murein transglycosylase [Aestuariivirga sp.]
MDRRTFASLLLFAPLLTREAFADDPKFVAFIQNTLWPRMKTAGVSKQLFDQAFAGITEPDPVVLKLADNQPEFTSTTSAYLEKAVTPVRIDTGRQKAGSEKKLLDAIEAKYGVDRYIILGIWGMESNFGKMKGSMSVMRSLATLAYSGRRKKYAYEQMAAAFRILKSGIVKPNDFDGSWAAAMGHTQFIPSSYISYAVDWTGDGRKDIWNSHQDALASTANYLARAGWRNDRPWGWEVTLPRGFDMALIGRSHWKTVAEWEKLGLRRADGAKFGSPDAQAFVMVPQGVSGPRFLVTKNFLAIMDYNISHSYALSVGHLADRIRGRGEFAAQWPEVSYDLTYKQRVELQSRLNALGFETGGNDGRFGARTYEAIIAYQKKNGLPLDGVPSVKLLQSIGKRG